MYMPGSNFLLLLSNVTSTGKNLVTGLAARGIRVTLPFIFLPATSTVAATPILNCEMSLLVTFSFKMTLSSLAMVQRVEPTPGV